MTNKPRHNHFAAYVFLYHKLIPIARRAGWTLAAHGSGARDLDLVMLPWVDKPTPHLNVIKQFALLYDLEVIPPATDETHPHGRRIYLLHHKKCQPDNNGYIDLSVFTHHESHLQPQQKKGL